MINGVSPNRITIIGRIVVSGPVGKDRSDGRASDESSQISRGVARLDSPLRSRGMGHIGDVINRRVGWNRVNLLWDRRGRRPGTRRVRRHEPDSLQAKIINVAVLDD